MKISARNMLAGSVSKAALSESGRQHGPPLSLWRRCGNHHYQFERGFLGLKEGKAAYAIIKSSSVMIAKG